MSSFKNTSSKMEIKNLEGGLDVPRVIFPERILAIMKYIVDNVPTEVGWLGAVTKLDNSYYITDIYVPKQDVNGGTCELNSNGLQDLHEWMVANGHEAKTDKIFFWGHSHGSMGVYPSGQDLAQSVEKLRDFAGTYFIRAICNKTGEMSVAFYDGVNKRLIENIEWFVHDGIDRKKIEEMYSPLIKENIKELTYSGPVSHEGYENGRCPGYNNQNVPGNRINVSDWEKERNAVSQEFARNSRVYKKDGKTNVTLKGER